MPEGAGWSTPSPAIDAHSKPPVILGVKINAGFILWLLPICPAVQAISSHSVRYVYLTEVIADTSAQYAGVSGGKVVLGTLWPNSS